MKTPVSMFRNSPGENVAPREFRLPLLESKQWILFAAVVAILLGVSWQTGSAQVAQLSFNPAQLNPIAGTGTGTANDTGDGGPALSATFDSPISAAEDASGNVYVVDQDDNYVRKIDTSGHITAFAGMPNTGSGSFSGD
jgi:hypothetical protein